jgi:hypothetical protein
MLYQDIIHSLISNTANCWLQLQRHSREIRRQHKRRQFMFNVQMKKCEYRVKYEGRATLYLKDNNFLVSHSERVMRGVQQTRK